MYFIGSIICLFLYISFCWSKQPQKTLIVTLTLIFMTIHMTENDKKI